MTIKIRLTPKRVEDLQHPEKGKSFLWDEICHGLGVLASPKRKNYIFEGRFNKKTIRITIGNTSLWTIDKARKRATDIRQLIDQGIDPRLEKKRQEASEETERAELKRQDVTFGEAWSDYIEDRKPGENKDDMKWSEKYHLDHIRFIQPGGKDKKRGKGKTVPGTLYQLVDLPLSQITTATVKRWISAEKKTRPTQTRIAFEMLKTFLTWCETEDRFKRVAAPEACTPKMKKASFAKKTARNDVLQKEQLLPWFKSASTYQNKVLSAYFQVLLLTGSRREEMLALKWSDIDFRWKSISLTQTKGGEPRIIPLTPYVASLLLQLPKRNNWVFSSPRGKDGRIQSPFKAFRVIIQVAGIEDLTLHGLRRSFKTLTEWIEAPRGVVHQIQGHKPSATAEKHYTVRPLDMLRMWHVKIEKWILDQAGIDQPENVESGVKLSLVQGDRA